MHRKPQQQVHVFSLNFKLCVCERGRETDRDKRQRQSLETK